MKPLDIAMIRALFYILALLCVALAILITVGWIAPLREQALSVLLLLVCALSLANSASGRG